MRERDRGPSAPRDMSETERVRGIYQKMAPGYDRQLDFADRFFFGEGRAWVCSQASGDVLELGVGTGRNLSFYPPGVRLTAIDLSPAMLEVARRRAQELGRAVDLRLGDAERLEFADGSFDSVVITLVLCTVPSPGRAIAEVRRVLRPGGRVILLEHVRSPSLAARAIEVLLDPIMVRLTADHFLREPIDDLTREGFAIERVERSKWGFVERATARRP